VEGHACSNNAALGEKAVDACDARVPAVNGLCHLVNNARCFAENSVREDICKMYTVFDASDIFFRVKKSVEYLAPLLRKYGIGE
jgi:hypothetical protein